MPAPGWDRVKGGFQHYNTHFFAQREVAMCEFHEEEDQ